MKAIDTKPVFQVKQKIDYSKSDNKLFTAVGDTTSSSDAKTARDESLINKKISLSK